MEQAPVVERRQYSNVVERRQVKLSSNGDFSICRRAATYPYSRQTAKPKSTLIVITMVMIAVPMMTMMGVVIMVIMMLPFVPPGEHRSRAQQEANCPPDTFRRDGFAGNR
jgi:hypothetical protein